MRKVSARSAVPALAAVLALAAAHVVAEAAIDPSGEDLIKIPAGKFVMGTDDGEAWEGPARTWFVPAFRIDRREVSNAEYARFVQATGHRAPALDEPWAKGASWTGTSPPAGTEGHPAVLVSRDDAAAYCAWRGARLPTTWEWEKAARGTDDAAWTEPPASANLRGADVDGHKRAAPVDAAPEDVSPYGVEQMTGNVGEWVAGDFVEDLTPAADGRGRPSRIEDLSRAREAGIAERRGGHWLTALPMYAAPWVRWRVQAYELSTVTGFRCAK